MVRDGAGLLESNAEFVQDVFVGMVLGWFWGAKGVPQELSTAVDDRIIPGMGREGFEIISQAPSRPMFLGRAVCVPRLPQGDVPKSSTGTSNHSPSSLLPGPPAFIPNIYGAGSFIHWRYSGKGLDSVHHHSTFSAEPIFPIFEC